MTVIPETNKKETGLRWKDKDPRTLKFVDDGMMLSKINIESTECLVRNGENVWIKHDVQIENVFRRVVVKVESRGRVVNNSKTKILCVSDSQSYQAEFFIVDSGGERIRLLKVLGFQLDSKPTIHAHVWALKLGMRETAWVLWHLMIGGFNEDKMATVYRTVVCPILDYCAVAYHPMLSNEQDPIIERLQAQALKNK